MAKAVNTPGHKSAPVYIALDVGGTKILAAAVDRRGRELRRERCITPRPLQEGLELLKALVHRLAAGAPVAAIGAAVGGPLDWRSGRVSPLHQPEWRDVPLKEIMQQAFGCPFYVDVDTNVAALGEYHFGASQVARLMYMTISTGIGGGLLVDGRIFRGSDGAHPEVGHHAIPFRCAHPERVVCDCGATACLEAMVSGTGIRRVYGKPAEQLSEAEWQEVGYNLGQGLRNIANFYTPDVIVLGGGVSIGAGERLLAIARRTMRQNLKIIPEPEVRLSRLGYDTALFGAMALALYGLAD